MTLVLKEIEIYCSLCQIRCSTFLGEIWLHCWVGPVPVCGPLASCLWPFNFRRASGLLFHFKFNCADQTLCLIEFIKKHDGTCSGWKRCLATLLNLPFDDKKTPSSGELIFGGNLFNSWMAYDPKWTKTDKLSEITPTEYKCLFFYLRGMFAWKLVTQLTFFCSQRARGVTLFAKCTTFKELKKANIWSEHYLFKRNTP